MKQLQKAQEEFISNVLSSLDKNTIPWRASWDQGIYKPYNASSMSDYQGMNQLNLWMLSLARGYDDPRWLTFKQAKEKGYSIQKGSVGTSITSFILRNTDTEKYVSFEDYAKMNEKEKELVAPVYKTYKVFHASQMNGIPPLEQKNITWENNKAEAFCNTLLETFQISLKEQDGQAFYNIEEDSIQLPKRNSFFSEEDYYATLLHELGHSTLKESRLNRKVDITDKKAYALEELRVELASAFLSMDLGFHMSQNKMQQHEAYISGWHAYIKEDPGIIFEAIKDAKMIQSYLLEQGNYQQLQNQSISLEQEVTAENYISIEDQDISIGSYLDYTVAALYMEHLGITIGYSAEMKEDGTILTRNELKELGDAPKEEHKLTSVFVPVGNVDDLLNYEAERTGNYLISPKQMTADEARYFNYAFECLTDPRFYMFDEQEVTTIQARMLEDAPINYTKMLKYRDEYITEDRIKEMSEATKIKKSKIEELLGLHEYNQRLEPKKASVFSKDLEQAQTSDIQRRIFIDMDGVLARFNNKLTSLDVLYEQGYFANLEPQENVVQAVQELIKRNKEEVYILSAALDSPYAQKEKKQWLKRHLPNLDTSNIILTPYGKNKVDYIQGKITSHDILLDDLTKNLDAWSLAGGSGIKLINDINDTNKSWQGLRLAYNKSTLADELKLATNQLDEGIDPSTIQVTLKEQFMVSNEDISKSIFTKMIATFPRTQMIVDENAAFKVVVFDDPWDTKKFTSFEQALQFELEETGNTYLKDLSLSEKELAYIKSTYQLELRANAKKIPSKETQKANDVDLEVMKNSISIVDYARDALGYGIIKEGKGLYRLEEHDSCKVYPNNSFYRFSSNVGGSIIDFIKHFEELDTKGAIEKMRKYYAEHHPEIQFDSTKAIAKPRQDIKGIVLPEKAESNKHVYAYLTKTRGIQPSIVQEMIDRKILYEDARNNCVFVGKYDGSIQYATLRSSSKSSSFKQDAKGSMKEVGIYIDNKSNILVVNEAIIDSLSYMSLADDSKKYNYLSVNGAANCESAVKFHLLKREEAKNVEHVVLALDNDDAGEKNMDKTLQYLKAKFPNIHISIHLPEAKDFNEQLMKERQLVNDFAPKQNASLEMA